MSLSLITLLVVAVICLLLGGIAGMLFGSSGGQQEEDLETAGEGAPPGGKKGRYTQAARLWREKNSGALVVEVGDKAYLAPEPLSADQRALLESTARDFSQWIGVSTPITAVNVAPPAERQTVPPDRPAAAQGPAVQAPVQPPIQPPPAWTAVGAAVGKPVTSGLPVQAKSMVEQIDAVLQVMIAGTEYEIHGLTLTEDPIRGVIVWVGSASYEGIDRVPDPAVQTLIRSAVAEWERREDEIRRRKA